MKHRMAFIAGAAVGYVLGTRAGRQRYEQLKRASTRVAEKLQLDQTAGVLRTQAGDMAGTARDRVSDTLHDRFGDKVDKIPGLHRPAGDEPSPQAASPATTTHL
jgi:hypothetical protein